MTSENIPIILISASNSRAADSIISEIINSSESEVKDDKCVWVISNKYYSARVLLHPMLDGERPAPPTPDQQDRIEAHIILIENREGAGEGEAEAERRCAAAGALAQCEVRLLVVTCPSPALTAWALRRRYELVSLASSAPEQGGEGEDEWENEAGESGAARVVAALHAHTWSGLVRAPRAEAGAGRGAAATHEQFAALMGSVRAAGERAAAMPREQRAHYAEDLVAAFCRALSNDHHL